MKRCNQLSLVRSSEMHRKPIGWMTEGITNMALHFERDDQLALLRGLPLFSDCTTYELKRIRSQMTSIEKVAGETLIEEGKVGSEFFVIVSGSASVWRSGRLLDHLQAGSFFGELSLLDGKCRSATVRAESPIHVLALYATRKSTRSTVRYPQSPAGYRLSSAHDFEMLMMPLTRMFHIATGRMPQTN